jgi:hypothetical protein
VTLTGWLELVRQYVGHKENHGGTDVKVLWIYAPNYTLKGQMDEIKSVTKVNSTELLWSQDEE